VSSRQVANTVFRSTHPVQWTAVDGRLVSPKVEVNGIAVTVVIHPGMFPRVVVSPGESFRRWSPWCWPRDLLFWEQETRLERQETKRRLFSCGVVSRDRGDR